MVPRSWLSTVLDHLVTDGGYGALRGGAHKPAPCASCGSRAELEHIRRGRDRYAQVQCRTCGAAGPEVRFDLSDEWPHILAEQVALAKWAWMQRKR